MTRLEETVLANLSPVENGVIRGAKLLGLNSRNGRRYESKALESAKPLYEGRKVYVDHPDEGDVNRGFNDWAGVIENVEYRKGDGLYGDVVLRQESSHFKGIVEAANNPKFSKKCGFSHVAEGESRYDGDTEIIESIKEVFSVDLVTDPATTAGIFESKRKKKKTVRDTIESLPDVAERKRLIEMVDAGFIDGAQSMDDSKEADDPLSMAYSTINELIAMLGETLKALAMKKDAPPAPAAPAPANPTDPAAAPAAKPADPNADPNKPSFESLQKELASEKAKNLLLESGREATPARVKALASVTDEAERTELLESWPVLESESGDRPLRSPALVESVSVTATDFDTPEKFAARYRS